MSLTELKGPFLLTAEGVRVAPLTTRAPGAYALGHTDAEGTFIVEKVGRSDKDVKEALQHFADTYQEFAFQYTASAKAAFERECDLYHNFMAGSGHVHPTRPEASYWKCPHCHLLD
jgi:hypothetical protein